MRSGRQQHHRKFWYINIPYSQELHSPCWVVSHGVSNLLLVAKQLQAREPPRSSAEADKGLPARLFQVVNLTCRANFNLYDRRPLITSILFGPRADRHDERLAIQPTVLPRERAIILQFMRDRRKRI